MWKRQLCLNTGAAAGLDTADAIKLIKKVGFDGVFACFDENSDVEKWAKTAKEENMIFQSLHAPMLNIDALWREGDERLLPTLDTLIKCITECQKHEIPLMICHAFIGFEDFPKISDFGLEQFGKLVRKCEETGVKIAFENTEGEEYLAAILNEFKSSPAVGFCLDTGHQKCYNRGKNLLLDYGDRLFGTHINDNLGISRADGKIFWTDDLHLLPFDGIIDWKEQTKQIDDTGFSGPYTFELKKRMTPGRFEGAEYERMPVEEYITACYVRACRVAALFKG